MTFSCNNNGRFDCCFSPLLLLTAEMSELCYCYTLWRVHYCCKLLCDITGFTN